MRVSGRDGVGGITKFFRIMFRHDSLTNHYQTNFALMQHHKYSLSELDNMMPWEKQVYIDLLLKFLDEETEKIKQEKIRAGKS